VKITSQRPRARLVAFALLAALLISLGCGAAQVAPSTAATDAPPAGAPIRDAGADAANDATRTDAVLDGWVTVRPFGAKFTVEMPPNVRRYHPLPGSLLDTMYRALGPRSGVGLTLWYVARARDESATASGLLADIPDGPSCGGGTLVARSSETDRGAQIDSATVACKTGATMDAVVRTTRRDLVLFVGVREAGVGPEEAKRFIDSYRRDEDDDRPDPVPLRWARLERPEAHFSVSFPEAPVQVKQDLGEDAGIIDFARAVVPNADATFFVGGYAAFTTNPAAEMTSQVEAFARTDGCGGAGVIFYQPRADVSATHLVLPFQIGCARGKVIAGELHAHDGRINILTVTIGANERRVAEADLDRFFSSYRATP
jgi:hypothetical protein